MKESIKGNEKLRKYTGNDIKTVAHVQCSRTAAMQVAQAANVMARRTEYYIHHGLEQKEKMHRKTCMQCECIVYANGSIKYTNTFVFFAISKPF